MSHQREYSLLVIGQVADDIEVLQTFVYITFELKIRLEMCFFENDKKSFSLQMAMKEQNYFSSGHY